MGRPSSNPNRDLLAAARALAGLDGPRPVGFRLAGVPDRLSIGATDYTAAASVHVDANVTGAFVTVVAAQDFLVAVRAAGRDPVRLEPSGERDLTLRSAGVTVTLRGSPAEDWPVLPDAPDGPCPRMTIPAAALARMIGDVVYAAARENARWPIHSVLLESAPDELRAAGTDGFRLALSKAPAEGSLADGAPARAPVPLPSARLLADLLDLEPEGSTVQLTLARDPGRLWVASDQLMYSTLLVDGEYPDYRAGIPEADVAGEATLEAGPLADSLSRVARAADPHDHTVRLELCSGALVLRASRAGWAEAEATLPAAYAGEPRRVAYNGVALAECVKSVAGGAAGGNAWRPRRIRLHLGEGGAPAYLADGDPTLAVIMPVTLPDEEAPQ